MKKARKYEDYGWGRMMRVLELVDVGMRVCDVCEGFGKIHIKKLGRAIDCPPCNGRGWLSK